MVHCWLAEADCPPDVRWRAANVEWITTAVLRERDVFALAEERFHQYPELIPLSLERERAGGRWHYTFSPDVFGDFLRECSQLLNALVSAGSAKHRTKPWENPSEWPSELPAEAPRKRQKRWKRWCLVQGKSKEFSGSQLFLGFSTSSRVWGRCLMLDVINFLISLLSWALRCLSWHPTLKCDYSFQVPYLWSSPRWHAQTPLDFTVFSLRFFSCDCAVVSSAHWGPPCVRAGITTPFHEICQEASS